MQGRSPPRNLKKQQKREIFVLEQQKRYNSHSKRPIEVIFALDDSLDCTCNTVKKSPQSDFMQGRSRKKKKKKENFF